MVFRADFRPNPQDGTLVYERFWGRPRIFFGINNGMIVRPAED